MNPKIVEDAIKVALDLAEEHLALWEDAEKRASAATAEADSLRRRLSAIPARAEKVASRLVSLGLVNEGHEKTASALGGESSLDVIEFLLDNFVQPPSAFGSASSSSVAPNMKTAAEYTQDELNRMSETDFNRVLLERMRLARS